jgi:hypothetical protein
MRWPRPRRRWITVASILALTVFAMSRAAHPAPVYQAVAVVAVQAPLAESAVDDHPNPYSDPRRSLAATAALVSQGMKSPSSTAALHAAGVIGTFDLEPRNSGTTEEPYFSLPRLDVTVQAGDPNTAIRSLGVLLAALDTELVNLQNQVGVYPTDRITTQLLVPPSASKVLGSKSRAMVAVGVLGIGSAVLIPRWWAEAAIRRSTAQRSRSAQRARQLA